MPRLDGVSGVRIIAAVTGIGLVVVYAVGSAIWVQTASAWYLRLQRPPWQPPDVVFGLIWPYNFIVLGIAMFVLARDASSGGVVTALVCFGLSVVAALAWSYLFYGPHRLAAAAAALVCAALLTIPALVVVFRTSPVLGCLLVPYQVWMCIAASLSWGYAVLNRDAGALPTS